MTMIPNIVVWGVHQKRLQYIYFLHFSKLYYSQIATDTTVLLVIDKNNEHTIISNLFLWRHWGKI